MYILNLSMLMMLMKHDHCQQDININESLSEKEVPNPFPKVITLEQKDNDKGLDGMFQLFEQVHCCHIQQTSRTTAPILRSYEQGKKSHHKEQLQCKTTTTILQSPDVASTTSDAPMPSAATTSSQQLVHILCYTLTYLPRPYLSHSLMKSLCLLVIMTRET